MQNLAPSDNKLVRNFAMKNDKKEEFFHSSGYGEAQNGGNIGTASTGLTMEERKAIEEKRKFVQKYNNSKIFSSTFNLRHAQKYTPRTEGGANSLINTRSHNRTDATGDANGNVRTSYGRTSGTEAQGNTYTPYKTANTRGGVTGARPSSAPSFKPKPVSFK